MRNNDILSCAIALALCLQPSTPFSCRVQSARPPSMLASYATEKNVVTRGGFISSVSTFLISATLPLPSKAEDEIASVETSKAEDEIASVETSKAEVEIASVETKVGRSLGTCIPGSNNCVSTTNVKQIELYGPPWTFKVSPDEAFARIKGVLASDPIYEVVEVDDTAGYIRADVQRTFLAKDEVEFLVKSEDKVVVYRSSEKEKSSLSDFGINRKRIDDIKKKGAVFDLMGAGMTADSAEGGGAAARGNNALGQLKAFYGLQGGKGIENAFDEG